MLTGRGHDVVATAPLAGVNAVGDLERVRYSTYGVPHIMPPADLTGDGLVDGADLQLVFNNFGNSMSAGWVPPAADLDLDGVVDGAEMIAVSNTTGSTARRGELSSHAVHIGFGGSVYDPAVGLWLMRHRWYDPDLGRFLTRDPAGFVDGMSLYQYVQGNPLVYFDPFGLWHITQLDVASFFSSARNTAKTASSEAVDRAVDGGSLVSAALHAVSGEVTDRALQIAEAATSLGVEAHNLRSNPTESMLVQSTLDLSKDIVLHGPAQAAQDRTVPVLKDGIAFMQDVAAGDIDAISDGFFAAAGVGFGAAGAVKAAQTAAATALRRSQSPNMFEMPEQFHHYTTSQGVRGIAMDREIAPYADGFVYLTDDSTLTLGNVNATLGLNGPPRTHRLDVSPTQAHSP